LLNILITGAGGYIGGDILHYLEKAKIYKINAIVKKRTNLFNNEKIKIIKHDLKKPLNFKLAVDGIIHCAEKNPLSSIKNYNENKQILNNLIRFSITNKVKKFIFLSSVSVYGDIKGKIIIEETKKYNKTEYGKAKFNSEKLLFRKNKDFKTIVLRLPGILVLEIKRKKPLLMSILNKALTGKKINIYNAKERFNNVLDTLELFKVINVLLRKRITKSSIYNISASNPIRFADVLDLIIKKTNSKSKINQKLNLKKSFLISNKKFSDAYNFKFASVKKIINRFCRTISMHNFLLKRNYLIKSNKLAIEGGTPVRKELLPPRRIFGKSELEMVKSVFKDS